MDNDNATVVDATVVPVEVPVVNPSVEAINAQKSNFSAQLEQVKKDMVSLQQQFQQKKDLALKLEGAIESTDILLKTLTK